MEKSKIITDINETFELSSSLWRLVGTSNKITIDMLKEIVDGYFNEKSDGRNPTLPSILLIGRSGCRTIARSFSNDLGQLEFKQALGHTLCAGEDIYEYFKNADDHTAFYISSCENLNTFAQNIIYKILRDKILYVSCPLERETIEVPFSNRLLILSAIDKKRLMAPLVKLIDIHCRLVDYSQDDLFQILHQRCEMMNLPYSPYEILKIIAKNAGGNAGQAVRILKMAYRVMRAQGESFLNVNHVNKAVLYALQVLIGESQG